MRRTHVQNYKDLVLANCIANAYAYDVKVGMMP
ncbi:T6SS amidase immunity protein Tai4 family protein [Pseudomonas syringae group genomosp. 3]